MVTRESTFFKFAVDYHNQASLVIAWRTLLFCLNILLITVLAEKRFGFVKAQQMTQKLV